jgi:hypothetical protein
MMQARNHHQSRQDPKKVERIPAVRHGHFILCEGLCEEIQWKRKELLESCSHCLDQGANLHAKSMRNSSPTGTLTSAQTLTFFTTKHNSNPTEKQIHHKLTPHDEYANTKTLHQNPPHDLKEPWGTGWHRGAWQHWPEHSTRQRPRG